MSTTIETTTSTTEAAAEVAPVATVTVNTVALNAALAKFAKVVPVKSARAFLQGIAIRTTSTITLSLFATDLEISLRMMLPIVTTAEGAIVADYKALVAAVKGIKTDKATLSIYDQKVIVEDTAGGMRSTVWSVGGVADFPEMALRAAMTEKNKDLFHDFSVPGAALAEGLRFTLNGVATGDTRYVLNGVYMSSDHSGGLEFAASNTFVLYTHRIPILSGDQIGDAGISLLPQAAGWLAKNAKDTAEVHIQTDPNMVFFRGEGWIFGTPQVGGMFPRYRDIMPAREALPGRLMVVRKGLLSALKTAMVHCASETRRIDILPAKDGEAVEVRAVRDGNTQFSMLVPAASRKCRPVCFNVDFLVDFLTAYEGDTVTIRYADNTRHEEPVALYDADKAFIIMPIDNADKTAEEREEYGRMIEAYQLALTGPDQVFLGTTQTAINTDAKATKRAPSFKAVVNHAKADPCYLSALLSALGIQAAAV